MISRYENRVVAITGAGRGMGLGLAERFAAEGATVILADRDPAVVETAVRVAEQTGATTLGVTCDVTDETRSTRSWPRSTTPSVDWTC